MRFEIELFEDSKRGTMAALANDTHISRWCMDQKSIVSDQTVPLHILPLFKEGDIVVDVGAFIGDHTVAYAERVGRYGRVVAFEPYPPAFACLVFNCRAMVQAGTYRCALGKGMETVKLAIPPHNNMGMVSIDTQSDVVHDVDMVALDSLAMPRCHFIKIDAEGYEPEVIKGGNPNHHPLQTHSLRGTQ